MRARAYLLGIALVVLNQLWLIEAELVRWSLFTNAVPFCNAIASLALLVGLNGLCCVIPWPRRALLTRGELLCVFTMTCIGAALGAQQMGQLLVSFLPFPFAFAGIGNRWPTSFMGYLPRRFMVDDPVAVARFYAGNTSLYRPEHWMPWLAPMLMWSAFTVVLVYTMLCVNTLLRRRWMVAERLTYPSVYLPLEMTGGSEFWRNRTMWIGFAVAGGVTLLNGISYFWPAVPMVPIRRQDIDPYITSPPWTGMGNVKVSFYFFAIGLAFIMPLDLSFSLWFFYVLYKLELVGVTALGIQQNFSTGAGFSNYPPYEHGQAFGAYMAVAATALWAARRDLADIFRQAVGMMPSDDAGEPMRYRTALIGALVGLALLCGFCVCIGMSPWVAVAFFMLYFLIVVVITRIRAEFGFPIHDMHYMGPLNPLLASVGTTQLGPRNLVAFSLTYWFNRTFFANPAPHALEGMKMADVTSTNQRAITRGIMLAACVGAVGLFWTYLNRAYDLGAGTARVERWPREFPGENFSRLHEWFITPGTPNFGSMVAAGVAFLISLGMAAARLRLAWFPLHPLGYAVANSWGLAQVWLPVAIGSILKAVVMRYGGLRVYRRAVPLFLGLILGEMLTGCMWSLYGIALGIRAYDFWP